MTQKERDELKRVYSAWSSARLAHTIASETEDYQPEAILLMRETLAARQVGDEFIAKFVPNGKVDPTSVTARDKAQIAFAKKTSDVFGRRAGAVIIDYVLVVAGSLGAYELLGEEMARELQLLWFPAIAYFVVLEGGLGATIGKKIMGLRVVNLELERCGYYRALVRTIIRCYDCGIAPLAAVRSFHATPSRQRLGDKLAGTLVVRLEDLTRSTSARD